MADDIELEDEETHTDEEGQPVDPGDAEETTPVDEETVPDVDDEGVRPDIDWSETATEGEARTIQTFTSQPVPPYYVGDVWQNGNDLYICIEDQTETFDAADWSIVAPSSDPVPTVTTKTITERITDFSAEKIAEYENSGAIAFALYDDGTRVQVQWSEVVEPSFTSPAADEAALVAQATNQYFWYDDNGAHVTDEKREDWEEEYAKTNHGTLATPTNQKPWHNILMNSLGILLRTGLKNLVSITRSAIAFFDGSGNESGNITAQFGPNGARIGKSSGKHVDIDSNSVDIYNGSTNVASFADTTRIGKAASANVKITSNALDFYDAAKLRIRITQESDYGALRIYGPVGNTITELGRILSEIVNSNYFMQVNALKGSLSLRSEHSSVTLSDNSDNSLTTISGDRETTKLGISAGTWTYNGTSTAGGTSYIYAHGGAAAYGANLFINAGGALVLGGGEFANNMQLNNIDSCDVQTETTHIGSDSKIYIYTNANTITNRQTWIIDTDGSVYYPSNTQKIHGSHNRYSTVVQHTDLSRAASGSNINLNTSETIYDYFNQSIYYSQMVLATNGNLYRSYVVQRKSADGETNYTSGFYIGIKNDGTPYVSFTSGAADVWRSALGLSASTLYSGTNAITIGSACTLVNAYIRYSRANVVTVYVEFKNKNAIADNGTITVGTVKVTSCRPTFTIRATPSNHNCQSAINTAGSITFYNGTGAQLAANGTYTISATYVV